MTFYFYLVGNMEKNKKSTMLGIASIIIGLIAYAPFWFKYISHQNSGVEIFLIKLSPILGIIASICGILSVKQSKNIWAVIGLVLGFSVLAFLIIILAISGQLPGWGQPYVMVNGVPEWLQTTSP